MSAIRDALVPVLEQILPRPAVRSIVATLPTGVNASAGTLDLIASRELLGQLEIGLRTFGGRPTPGQMETLKASVTGGRPVRPSDHLVKVAGELDVVMAQRATQAMTKNFFGATDCVRLTTVVSELARNIYMYTQGGEVRLSVTEENKRIRFDVVAKDDGPGIPNIDLVLSGAYVSKTGLGRGLYGAKRIFDEFTVDSAPGRGTRITGVKRNRG